MLTTWLASVFFFFWFSAYVHTFQISVFPMMMCVLFNLHYVEGDYYVGLPVT